jgi:GNAT superfamily N-acetyltransferase
MKHVKLFEAFNEEKKFDTIPAVANFPAFWQSQVKQYPAKGEAGISYFKGEMGKKWVDCLLYRDDFGKLLGALNHYPFDFPPYEKKGNINIMVDPKEQGKGIGQKLFAEAVKRWDDIDFHKQEWTPGGKHLLDTYLKKNEQETSSYSKPKRMKTKIGKNPNKRWMHSIDNEGNIRLNEPYGIKRGNKTDFGRGTGVGIFK